MKLLPKNLCKNLSVLNGVGLCNLRNCVCSCWLCEYKDKCGREVFENCQLKSGDFREVTIAYAFYDDAIKSIDKKIQSIMETEDRVKIIGGLLFLRETEILRCFYGSPGDLPSIVSTVNSYISRDLSAIGYDDIKHNEIAEKVWNLLIVKEVFSNTSSRLRNGDVICYGNKYGEDELRGLVGNPEYQIELMNSFVEKKVPPPIEGRNVREVYSSKMLPVIQWCLMNVHQVDMWDYTLQQNFSRILKHIQDVGASGEISPSICYRLAYPHYAGMLHSCRYIYSKFKHVKEISLLNRGIDQVVRTKYLISFDVGKFYDNFLVTLWGINNNGRVCLKEIIGKDTENYRFIIKDGALFGSVLLLGFISKNYDSVCLKPYERGRVFEDFVEKELLDRQVAILRKNFETPKGEIDFVCSKNGKTYFMEAKDYSPWFDDSYIGSKTYFERVESISKKLERAPPRLQWVESNRSALGIPASHKITGVVLTRFLEPHIRIPTKFHYLTIDELDKVFGESRYHKIYETNIRYRFGKAEVSIMEKELLEKKDREYAKYGLR